MLSGRKKVLKHILNTRGGFFVAGIILSVSSIIILHEVKPCIDYITEGYSYTVPLNRASAEVSPQVGEVVEQSTGSLANNSMEQNSNSKEIKDLVARYFQAEAKTE